MAYVKNDPVWTDEVLDGAVTYEIDGVGGKTIALETPILVPATPTNAERMNHIEEGIEDLDTNKLAIASKANAAEALAGTDNTKYLTALAAATNKLVGSGTLGAPATTLTISSLDLNANGGEYDIEISNLTNDTGTAELLLLINGDTTVTNYYSYILGSGASSDNTPEICECGTDEAMAHIKLKINNNKVLAYGFYVNYDSGSSPDSSLRCWEHKSTQTNVTSISIKAGANNLGTGTTMKIYKR